VAGLLALIPVALRTPDVLPGYDVWRLYGRFGLEFLGLPLAIGALIASNRYGAGRDAAAGAALGLAVVVLGDLAVVRQAVWAGGANGSTEGAGWWLPALGAYATILVVAGWRGYCARWPPIRWTGLVVAATGLGIVAFGRVDAGWYLPPNSVAGRDKVVLAAVVILALITLFRPAGGPRFLIAAALCAIVAGEMFGFHGEARATHWTLYGTLRSDSVAAAIGLIGVGVFADRYHDRLFLLVGRIAAACLLLLPLEPSGPVSDRAEVHVIAFAVVVLLAGAGFRRVTRVMPRRYPPPTAPPPWAPPPAGASYRR
jgi:hypothetical protein